MKFDLANKKAIVTGGGSGIGRAIAMALAGQGAEVHILEVNAKPAKETAAEIKATGGDAQAHACDVSNQKDVIKTVAGISADRPIDILINNAGIAHIGNVELT
ncbi:SDR family NAD(P)-dependent oxidoreductase, partial [Eudoraea sp.]